MTDDIAILFLSLCHLLFSLRQSKKTSDVRESFSHFFYPTVLLESRCGISLRSETKWDKRQDDTTLSLSKYYDDLDMV